LLICIETKENFTPLLNEALMIILHPVDGHIF